MNTDAGFLPRFPSASTGDHGSRSDGRNWGHTLVAGLGSTGSRVWCLLSFLLVILLLLLLEHGNRVSARELHGSTRMPDTGASGFYHGDAEGTTNPHEGTRIRCELSEMGARRPASGNPSFTAVTGDTSCGVKLGKITQSPAFILGTSSSPMQRTPPFHFRESTSATTAVSFACQGSS